MVGFATVYDQSQTVVEVINRMHQCAIISSVDEQLLD